MVTRVLFVCMGNICRSPAAEIIFRKLVAEAGLEDQIRVDSAGTIGYHAGNSPDPRMSDTLRARGYDITGRSRQVQKDDLEAFDWIVTMDDDNFADVSSLDPSGMHTDKIHSMVEFASKHDDENVPDPYYGGQKGFEHVANLLEDACSGLLEEIRKSAGL